MWKLPAATKQKFSFLFHSPSIPISIVFWSKALGSTVVTFAALWLLYRGQAAHAAGMPWGPIPNSQNVILRALFINMVQISLVTIPSIFVGYNVVTHKVRRGLYLGHALLLALSWPTLILQYFHSRSLAPVEHDMDLIGFLGVPITLWILGEFLIIYQRLVQHLEVAGALAEQISYTARTDPLTGLPNRSHLLERLQQDLLQFAQKGQSLGLLLLDINGFKVINEAWGYPIGDELLQQMAQRLQDCVVQTGEKALLARIGGNEFAIITSSPLLNAAISPLAQVILSAMQPSFTAGSYEMYVDVSIGAAQFPEHGKDAESLLRCADIALHRAKSIGTHFAAYTAGLATPVKAMQLVNALHKAVERREFTLYYQPKIHLQSGQLAGWEALLRWPSRELKRLIFPGEFIPVLESSGLIVPVGEWVIREAARQVETWRKAGLPTVPVSVNVSPRQIQQGRVYEVIATTLADTGIPTDSLEVELTESTFLHQLDIAAELMKALNGLGIRLALDDFGTGYSSLRYLRYLPLDTLKIDQSFIAEMEQDTSIVDAVIALGHGLGLQVVAEGIETPIQQELLRHRGCDTGQGYLYSRPIPGAEVPRWCVEHPQFVPFPL